MHVGTMVNLSVFVTGQAAFATAMWCAVYRRVVAMGSAVRHINMGHDRMEGGVFHYTTQYCLSITKTTFIASDDV